MDGPVKTAVAGTGPAQFFGITSDGPCHVGAVNAPVLSVTGAHVN